MAGGKQRALLGAELAGFQNIEVAHLRGMLRPHPCGWRQQEVGHHPRAFLVAGSGRVARKPGVPMLADAIDRYG